jgi:hypothetical protein
LRASLRPQAGDAQRRIGAFEGIRTTPWLDEEDTPSADR